MKNDWFEYLEVGLVSWESVIKTPENRYWKFPAINRLEELFLKSPNIGVIKVDSNGETLASSPENW